MNTTDPDPDDIDPADITEGDVLAAREDVTAKTLVMIRLTKVAARAALTSLRIECVMRCLEPYLEGGVDVSTLAPLLIQAVDDAVSEPMLPLEWTAEGFRLGGKLLA